MGFKFEIPEETFVINRKDLKEALKELIEEVQDELNKNDIMTVKETAAYLKVSIPTVRNFIANKEIPHFHKGQVIRFKRSDLNKWIRDNG